MRQPTRDDAHVIVSMPGLILYSLTLLGMSLVTLNANASGSLQIQYLQDSSNTEDIFIDLNTELSKKVSLFASAGITRSPVDAADLDLDYQSLGLELQISKRFDVEFEIGQYGQGRDINAETFATQLRWATDDWSFSFKPQYNEFEVLLTTLNRTRKFDSTGIGLTLGYYGIENWEYTLSYDTYDYSFDLRILPLIARIRDISAKALTVAYGLKDHVVSADITYLASQTDITLSYARSQSAIDHTSSNITSLAFDFYHYQPYKLGIELGAVGSDIDTASYYGGMTAGYSW